jgi:hypothetical protein
MSLDLNKLENKLDEALSNETSETLNNWLNDKRMINNKQQTAVQLIIQALDIECKSRGMNVNWDMYLETEKERIETAYNKGTVHGIDYPESTLPITGEQYYNETYGRDEQ